jgi:hypothetical protein
MCKHMLPSAVAHSLEQASDMAGSELALLLRTNAFARKALHHTLVYLAFAACGGYLDDLS